MKPVFVVVVAVVVFVFREKFYLHTLVTKFPSNINANIFAEITLKNSGVDLSLEKTLPSSYSLSDYEALAAVENKLLKKSKTKTRK